MAGTAQFQFSDFLGNHNLGFSVGLFSNTLQDLNAIVAYRYLPRRWDFSISAFHVKYYFSSFSSPLGQDFGYRHFTGSIGDTVYQDANGNATQDPGEPGIAGGAVHLFLCSWSDDGDGLFESGEETGCPAAMAEAVTASDDPATPAAEGGTYLFTNLDVPAAGQYYVVRVVTSSCLAHSHLRCKKHIYACLWLPVQSPIYDR